MTRPRPDLKRLSKALMAWYGQNKRDLPWRRTDDPYAVWISEVMLQQTQVKTVVPYYRRFMELFPSLDRLARADLQLVLKAWEGLGYYSRARNLHRAARIVCEQMGGRFPDQWDDLRQLPGVGDYIASAVASIALHLPHAVVDGNVKRVLARIFMINVPVNQASAHKEFQQQADRLLDLARPGEFNQALMELGALICLPRRPLCRQCPLTYFCRAAGAGMVMNFPLRTRRRPVPTKEIAAAAIWKQGRLLLIQRPAQGLLGGLWELPAIIVPAGQDPQETCIAQVKKTLNLDISIQRSSTVVNHSYTHFKIRMTLYESRWLQGKVRLQGPEAFHWITPDQVGRFALHKAMAKAWPHIVPP